MGIILSICIPTYAPSEMRAGTLRTALESIAMQINGCEQEVEVCISDNFSCPAVAELAKKYSKRIPLQYHRMEQLEHPFFNWTYPIKNMAKGEYILLLGDDDIIVNEGIKRLIQTIKDNPYDYYYLNHCHNMVSDLKNIVEEDKCHYIVEKKNCEVYERDNKVIDKWESILNMDGKNRECNMLYIGNHVFKTDMWDIELGQYSNYVRCKEINDDTLEEAYSAWSPQITNFAKCMMGKSCYYIGEPIIVQGIGTTATDDYGFEFLTFLPRWIQLFRDMKMDDLELEKYIAYIDRHALARYKNMLLYKPQVIERHPYCLNYLKERLKSSEFFYQMFQEFSSQEGNFYHQLSDVLAKQHLNDYLKTQKGKIVLWGTGDVAKNYLVHSDALLESVNYIVDANLCKRGKEFEMLHLPIHGEDELEKEEISLIIICTMKYEADVIKYIIEHIGELCMVLCSKGLIKAGEYS